MKISAVSGYSPSVSVNKKQQSFKALVGQDAFLNAVQREVTNIPAFSIESLVTIVKDAQKHFDKECFKNIVVVFKREKSKQAGTADRIFCNAQNYNTEPPTVSNKELTADLLDLSSTTPKKSTFQLLRELKGWFNDFAGYHEEEPIKTSIQHDYEDSYREREVEFDFQEIWDKYSGYGPWDSPYT